jgi:hypothetical protein
MNLTKTFKIAFISVLLISTFQNVHSQPLSQRYNKFGEVIISQLSNAPFPHPKRISGHAYDNKIYSFEEHYNDSTVLVFVPKGFQPKEENDFVIHLHGWYNNVDSVLSQFKLIEQFCESKKNAILIVPQGPKNAPDSFGGKLEEQNAFRDFMNEVTQILYREKIISSRSIGTVILSGHSGAFRVISFILIRGGLTENIKEVFLFDGLYSQLEKYSYWLDHFNVKFINIYTREGGTKDQSENLIECFDAWNMQYILKNETDLSQDDLNKNRVIFIYSDLEHNDVIHVRSQFMKYLKASCLEDL